MHLTPTQITLISAGASVLVAGGTIFLGFKTRAMAKQTGDMAVATKRAAEATEVEAEAVTVQSELSRNALQASIRPWLTRVGPPAPRVGQQPGKALIRSMAGEQAHEVYIDQEPDGSLRVALYLQNIGSGIALIGSNDECVIEGGGLNEEKVTRFGFPTASALGPGQVTRIGFKVEHVDPARFFDRHNTTGQFWVNIRYADANTEQPVWMRIHMTGKGPLGSKSVLGEQWFFYQIHYTREGEEEPFAMVQFDAALL